MVVFVLWWCLSRLTFLSILAAGTEQCETWVKALQALRRVLRQLTSPGPDSSVEERRLQIKGTMTVSQNIWKYAEAELPIIPRSWLRSLTIVVKEEKKVPVRTLSDQSLSRISHMPSKKCVPALGHCFPWFRFKIYFICWSGTSIIIDGTNLNGQSTESCFWTSPLVGGKLIFCIDISTLLASCLHILSEIAAENR